MKLNILKALEDIRSAIATLKARKNTYYHTAGSVASKYSKSFRLTQINKLPVGTYLVLGNVVASVSADSILLAYISAVANARIILGQEGRGTMIAGGGVSVWSIVEVTANGGTINLEGYGYLNASYTQYGKLIAIRLI